jgi:hypothetical protein
MLLTSCAYLPQPSEHSLDGWRVRYNDREAVERLCGKNAFQPIGCADFREKVIYCEYGDDVTCGHELRHVTHGRFH